MNYTIGEAARSAKITTSTLRYYDKEGLLPSIERTDGGIRIFHESDLEWLRIIDCLKKTGLSLADIKEYISLLSGGDETVDERLAMFYRQRENLKRQIKELSETLDIVDYKCWYYETAKECGIDNMPEITEEELPEKIRKAYRKLKEN